MRRGLALNVNGVLGEYFNPIVYGAREPGFAYLAGKFWDVEEEVWTGYLRGDLSHEISDTVTLRATLACSSSLRTRVRVRSSSRNWRPGRDAVRRQDVHDFLPQINFAFLLANDQAVRIGLAKELARPRMDELKATDESGYNSATGVPTAGRKPEAGSLARLGLRHFL